jgi:hypothetical protein
VGQASDHHDAHHRCLINGLRITPNVYTTLDEADRFSEKVLEAVARGVNA